MGSAHYTAADVDRLLAHYGVKGMRWGHRKSQSSSDATPASSDSAVVTDHKNRVATGGTRTLSNKELRELVDRMNLEQQYANLNKKSRPYKTGFEAVKEIMSVVKTVQEIHGAFNSPLAKDIRNAMKKRRGG